MQQILENQKRAEVVINENFISMLLAEAFAKDPTTTTGLTWGYCATMWPINGVLTLIAAGTLTLTNTTNYIGVKQDGTVTVTTVAPDPLAVPLYTVVCVGGLATAITDNRTIGSLARHSHGIATQALTTANVTITQAQAMCDTLVVTGALTAVRNLVVPLIRRRWAVRHTGTTNSVQIIGATGTGVTIAVGKTAIVECDGTNVNRITADA